MVIPVSGWAMERFGAKQMWMFSLALSLASSVLSRLAHHGLRLLARQPRRGVPNALSIAVTVTGIVAILASHTFNARGHAGLDNLKIDRLDELTVIITVMLVILAAANTTLHHPGGRGRRQAVIGAGARVRRDPRQVSVGLSAAQSAAMHPPCRLCAVAGQAGAFACRLSPGAGVRCGPVARCAWVAISSAACWASASQGACPAGIS